MKIILVGTGKTGRAVERVAIERGHDVVARFNSTAPLLSRKDDAAFSRYEAVIDFSKPELALQHIRFYCESNLTVVMGTTGWYEQVDQVAQWVRAGRAGFLYAPNFSIGVAVLSRALESAASMVDKLPEYDAGVHEMHHRFKLDSPSGTALHLAGILLRSLGRKERIAAETQHQEIHAGDLHVTSQRLGYIFGQHAVTFDSPHDRIVLSHEAKNRDGFAMGAVRAAEWIAGKTGFFTLDDLLDDWFGADSTP